jgi:hypothetical protein
MILDYLSFIKESHTDSIRVSCAGLASINIDGKYLLVQNKRSKSKGVIAYGPLGGALEYLPSGLEFLNSLGVEFERETPDLRFSMDKDLLDIFVDWFYNNTDREKSSKRELIEELVIEENILNNLSESDMTETHIDTIRDRSGGRSGVVSERIFEIFEISFNKEIEEKLKEIATQPDSTIGLFSEEDIIEGGGKIASHSKFILKK